MILSDLPENLSLSDREDNDVFFLIRYWLFWFIVSGNKFQSVNCEHNSTGRSTHLDNNSPGVSNFIVDKPDNDYTSFPSNVERNNDDNQSCLLLSKKRKVKMKVNESESKSKTKGGCDSKMKRKKKQQKQLKKRLTS